MIVRVLWIAALVIVSTTPLLGVQALPFHTETAITTGFQEEAARTFGAFFGRQGLRRDGSRIADPLGRDVDVFVQAFGVLPYAISPLWTTRIAVPVMRRSLDFTPSPGTRSTYSTTGVGDILIDTKWIFYSKNRLQGTTRLGIQGGVEVPVGRTDARMPDGTLAARPLQLGSGSWDIPVKVLFTMIRDRFGLHANVGYRVNTAGDGYDGGDVFRYDFAAALRLAPWVYESLSDQTLVLYLEVNGEVAQRDRMSGASIGDSGGHLVFLSPDLQWVPLPWLLFEGSVQVPIVQDLNGTQLAYGPRIQIGTRFRFSFFR